MLSMVCHQKMRKTSSSLEIVRLVEISCEKSVKKFPSQKQKMLENLSKSDSICGERVEPTFQGRGYPDPKRWLYSLSTDAVRTAGIFQHFLFLFQIPASAVFCFYSLLKVGRSIRHHCVIKYLEMY